MEPEREKIAFLLHLVHCGNYVDAEKLAMAMTRDYPRVAIGWKLLGVVLQQTGRDKDALWPMQKAAELTPRDAGNFNDLGVLQKKLGRLKDAEASYQHALILNPGMADVRYNLGNLLRERGLFKEAADCLRQAITLKPDYADAHISLGLVLRNQGKLAEAETCYRTAITLAPGSAVAYSNLGSVLHDLNRFPEAENSYRQAIALQPGLAAAHNNLGVTLRILGQLRAAEETLRRAITINPNYPEAYNNLGNILREASRVEEAIGCYRQALKLKPDYAMAYSNLLFSLNYAAMATPEEVLPLARRWEQSVLSPQARREAHRRDFFRHGRFRKPLKVGYVSGDYLQHAVSYFIGQVFKHHDRARVEIYAYSNNAFQDEVTKRIRSQVDQWVEVSGISDDHCVERIRADGIDVLIDLSGHTAYNRLGVFARRAAPVQAHYLGYFASTGLTEMDYWIGDDIITPSEMDKDFSERVWRLPRLYLCYEENSDAPKPEWRPADHGTLWVGNFCNLAKLTSATFDLWAKVLRSLPQMNLLLKTKEFAEPGNRQHVISALVQRGIEASRIELHDRHSTPDWNAHMAFYNRLDMVLDVVGANRGATSTCDALWMGLPVISMTGDRMADRMTTALLYSIGRKDFIARNDEEYVSIVHRVAYDIEMRKEMRYYQREQMRQSPICDGPGLARALEDSYETMYKQRGIEKDRG